MEQLGMEDGSGCSALLSQVLDANTAAPPAAAQGNPASMKPKASR
jgi:hypothetical protein